jgi:hypothetical protein
MLRGKLQLAAVAIVMVVGVGTRAQAASPCALLTTNDVSTALGMPVKNDDTASEGVTNECIYESTTTAFEGETPTVTLIISGGRAEYDQAVSTGKQFGMPTTPLSGIGDQAYENNNCGEQCAQVGVMEGKTYFTLMVQEDVNHTRNAAALARKVAERMK